MLNVQVLTSREANFAVAPLLLPQANCLQKWRKSLLILWICSSEASLVSLIAKTRPGISCWPCWSKLKRIAYKSINSSATTFRCPYFWVKFDRLCHWGSQSFIATYSERSGSASSQSLTTCSQAFEANPRVRPGIRGTGTVPELLSVKGTRCDRSVASFHSS